MSQKIKLIWDFRGPDALETARHHSVHLKEFAIKENLPFHKAYAQKLNSMTSVALIIINRADMKVFRDTLHPHRAEQV